MSKRSSFIKGSGPLSKAEKKFEQWLTNEGYQAVSDMYPAAVEVITLVDDYIREFPERAADRRELEQHSEDIGFVSDYVDDEIDIEEDDDIGKDHRRGLDDDDRW